MSKNGGKGRSFQSNAPNQRRYNPEKLVPKNVSVSVYEAPKSLHPDEEEPVNEQTQVSALKVKSIDFNVANNARNHKTDMYEMTWSRPDDEDFVPSLVVRRAQEFTLTLTFDRDYNMEQDKVELALEIGDTPIISKGTLVHLTPEYVLRPRHWSASVQARDGAKLSIAILTPPDCSIGKWRLSVLSSINTQPTSAKTQVLKYIHPEPIYMILNPFCKDDTVHLENEVHLDEYILNDAGKIYSGNYKQLAFKPWCFGQFENPVLECSMSLLEKSCLNLQSRGNPVAITRAISNIVNARDDSGVLEGNWSGSYEDGTAPSHWTGSAPILEEYHRTNAPVRYGQSWVYAGLCTTLCRALGLPSRCVTNYSSAHDCDGSTTIDVHWDDHGNPITENNHDSIWAFHVWNEAWMSRPDLDAGYGCWQAFDSTPQQTSRGFSCAGPVSVRALREGIVNFPHDASLMFAEINADKVHWVLRENGDWSKITQKHGVGKKISTKRPRGEDDQTKRFALVKDDADRLDITDAYKFKEDTEAERAAVLKANTMSTKSDICDQKDEDVKFVLAQKDDILVGNSFDVILKVVNKSRERRSVHIFVSLETIHVTGVHVKTLKSKEFFVELQAIKTEEAVVRVLAEEYLTYLADQAAFRINVLAFVEETKQLYADSDDFRLRRPDLEFECPTTLLVGRPFNVLVKFANSLPEHLGACEWMVECPGLQKATKHKHKNLEPYDRAQLKLSFTPQKPGKYQLVASFTSKELMDVTGLLNLDIKEL